MVLSPIGWLRLLCIGLSLYVLSQVTEIYLPIILATVIAFILNPVVNYISTIPVTPRGHYIPRAVVTIVVMLASIILFGAIVTFIFLPFMREFTKFLENLPFLFEQIQSLTLVIQDRSATLALEIPQNIQTVIEKAVTSAATYTLEFIRHGVLAILGWATRIIELVVVPVLVYYFLKDGKSMKQGTIGLFTPNYQQKVKNILEETGTVIGAYIQGQVFISILMGTLVFSGLYFMNIDYPLVLGLLAALTETIPIVGPIVGAIPAIILAYLMSPDIAVKVVIFYIVLHQLENHVIVPNIMGHTIALHPVVVIISLLIASQLFGIVGMMLAVPVAAILRVLVRQLGIVG